MDTQTIIANIRRCAAELIVDEILEHSIARVANTKNCIEKVKRELNIDLVENEQGYLTFA